jgi:L-fuculose-phosphate aldolase
VTELATDPAVVAAEIVRVARLLRTRGLAIGTSGNVGARLDDGRLAITPSSMDYDVMTPEDVVIVEPDGSPSAGRRRPSSELPPLHLALFAARPDVGAIVHTHSPFATTFAAVRREVPPVHYVLAPLVAPGHDALRVADYATFGSEELARNAVAALGTDNACLLANHGAIAVARTLATAFSRAERVEELAMIAWRAEQIGGAARLSAAQLDDAREQMARFPLQTAEETG